MFGGPLEFPKKPPPRCRQIPVKNDIRMPLKPGFYGHMAREPNTDYHVKLFHYQQRDKEFRSKAVLEKTKEVENEFYKQKFEKHTDGRIFRNEIKNRVDARLQEYENELENRRTKLRLILAREEREFAKETVDRAQRGGEDKFILMKKKAEELKAQREAERKEIVHQKRIQQYMARCMDLRPSVTKKNLIESKSIQLQQIKENEARREADRELDMMWHHASELEEKAMKEREIQDARDRYNRTKEMKDVLDMQIKGKEILRQEQEEVARSDKVEMLKLAEEIQKENIEALKEKIRKRNAMAKELREQIQSQSEFMAQRKKAEKALDDAFATLTQMEIDREHAATKDYRSQAKREMAMYMQNLKDLEEQRKEEEKKLMEMLNDYQKIVRKKQDEAQCKIFYAKEELKKNVLAGRDEQLRLKREEAEQQLKFQQAENELLQIAIDMNKSLEEETKRRRAEAQKIYGEDLAKQVEYNKLLAEREREELERRLQLGRLEEERYEQFVAQLISGVYASGPKHPFRKAIENYDCHCPTVRPK